MSISELHEKKFSDRLKISDFYTKALMKYLEKLGQFKIDRQATQEEEHQGIDWWVTYTNESVPIQFKLRDKRKDIPVCRYQPLYGIDDTRNIVGRDFRGLSDKKTQFYYVAYRDIDGKLFSAIYRVSSDKLSELVVNLDKAWQKTETQPTKDIKLMFGGNYNHSYFTNENVESWVKAGVRNKLVFNAKGIGEIWWKKNYNEGRPKLNFYLPYTFREETYHLSESISNKINDLYKKAGESCRLE